jgi:DNA-binding protein H-NS
VVPEAVDNPNQERIMSDNTRVETLAAVTQRPVFDSASYEEISQSLRKVINKPLEAARGAKKKITEPETPAAVSNPADQSAAIGEASESAAITAPKKSGPIKAPNLDDMTLDELKRQQAELERRIRQKTDAQKREVIAQIVTVVKQYNIPVEEIVAALGGLPKTKRKGKKAEPKYQDPDSGAIWTGRGKEPAWIKDKDREAFLIKE